MATKRFRNQTIIVNESTGEVTERSKEFTLQTSSERFYMTFLSNMASFYRINSITDIKILAFLCGAADFNTGHVSLTPAKRKDMLEQLELNNRQTVTNSLTRLKKLGLVVGEDGEYDIDPRVFWKGSVQEREKLLMKGGFNIDIKFAPKED